MLTSVAIKQKKLHSTFFLAKICVSDIQFKLKKNIYSDTKSVANVAFKLDNCFFYSV